MDALKESFFWGFDSFAGLPAVTTTDGSVRGWGKGAYSADPRTALYSELGPKKVDFVQGFYNESLAEPNLVEKRGLQVAKYVDIDVDLYPSARDVLWFLFQKKLIRPGTLIGYDDWWSVACDLESKYPGKFVSPLSVGEGRAHAEAAKEFDVTFACVAGGCMPPEARLECKAYGSVFMVTSIGKVKGGETGFALTNAEVQRWMQTDPVCQTHIRKYRFIKKNRCGQWTWPEGVHYVPPPDAKRNPLSPPGTCAPDKPRWFG